MVIFTVEARVHARPVGGTFSGETLLVMHTWSTTPRTFTQGHWCAVGGPLSGMALEVINVWMDTFNVWPLLREPNATQWSL